LHTHIVLFNLTEAKTGEARALQPHELYRSQQYATAIYRSELALRRKDRGYEIERGKSGQPEIAGYTREYLDAAAREVSKSRPILNKSGAAASIAPGKNLYCVFWPLIEYRADSR
jgi:conjugative relaxase-like TrwC/TraI family protein